MSTRIDTFGSEAQQVTCEDLEVNLFPANSQKLLQFAVHGGEGLFNRRVVEGCEGNGQCTANEISAYSQVVYMEQIQFKEGSFVVHNMRNVIEEPGDVVPRQCIGPPGGF